MNLRVTITGFMLFTAIALITYGMSGYLHSLLGWQTSILAEAWKLVAIAVGAAVLAGFLYPHARGIRKGDQLVAFMQRGGIEKGLMSLINSIPVTAMEAGRTGKKIRVQLPNGSFAEGIITGYAGTLSPPTIRLTEAEFVEFGEPSIFRKTPRKRL